MPPTTATLQSARRNVVKLMQVLRADLPRLEKIDRYLHGVHEPPYMPPNADAEYRLLAGRSVTNLCPFLVSTPAQGLYVDSFRRGEVEDDPSPGDNEATPEMDHWDRSRLGAKQSPVHRGALGYGHAFTHTYRDPDEDNEPITRGLSPLRTAALFKDPANDLVPRVAFTVDQWQDRNDPDSRATATYWDGKYQWDVSFLALSDPESVRVGNPRPHGATSCPITRFAAQVDLDGRTLGVVEPMIELQDRINQTVFDLLVAQTYASTEARWVSGMAPPMMTDEDGELVLDGGGNPQPAPVFHNARRMMFAENPEARFGSLPGSPLGGFIEAVDMGIRHLSAISQTPPHHLLGQIANLSADALNAAETALQRKIKEFQALFGESWERVFRLAAELAGERASEKDFRGEVLWRDVEGKSLAQAGDGLGKFADQLDVPKRGLWEMIPGVTNRQLRRWNELRQEDDLAQQQFDSVQRATPTFQPAVFDDANAA